MATHQKVHLVDAGEPASTSMRSEKSDPIHPFPSHRNSGDLQKIHPVDHVEASSSSSSSPPPPVPLEQSESFRLENGEAIERTAPSDGEAGQSAPPSRISRWGIRRCICWTSIILLIIIILLGIIAGILYLVYRPKVPRYSGGSVEIDDFGIFPNATIYASFNVSITAVNRNKRIGIYYDGGQMTVWYTNNSLCSGPLPYFYQRPRNTTLILVVLSGSTQYGSTLMNELLELERDRWIPLDLRTNVPVRVKLGAIKIRLKFRVHCGLVVNTLSAQSRASIRASNCTFNWKL